MKYLYVFFIRVKKGHHPNLLRSSLQLYDVRLVRRLVHRDLKCPDFGFDFCFRICTHLILVRAVEGNLDLLRKLLSAREEVEE